MAGEMPTFDVGSSTGYRRPGGRDDERRKAALERCFVALDKDASGYIDVKELKQYLFRTGVALSNLTSSAQELMAKLDVDGDEQVRACAALLETLPQPDLCRMNAAAGLLLGLCVIIVNCMCVGDAGLSPACLQVVCSCCVCHLVHWIALSGGCLLCAGIKGGVRFHDGRALLPEIRRRSRELGCRDCVHR